jgi:hypothetical protein
VLRRCAAAPSFTTQKDRAPHSELLGLLLVLSVDAVSGSSLVLRRRFL